MQWDGRMMMRRLAGLGALASAPQLIDYGSRFARTVILARMLSPREFGISVAIGVLIAIADLISDMGLDKFVISHPRRNDPDVLAAAHGLLIVRGVVLAAGIFVAAPWIARLLDAPGQAASFRWCGAIVLVHAFVHLEPARMQRDFHYAPQAAAIVLARLAAFAAVYPAARAFGDHRAMILSLFINAAIFVAATHLFAQTRYRIVTTDRAVLREALAYGLPLTVNGIGLAVNSQFDRVVVSHWLGIERLAMYSVILNLAMTPLSVIFGVLGLLGLSFLAHARDQANSRQNPYVGLVWVYATIASAYAILVAGTLDILAPLVFGHSYTVSQSAHVLILLVAWVRINRGAPTTQMLVTGDTRRLTVANLAAGGGLVLAAALLPLAPRLETVLACVLFGDVLSLAVFFWGVRGGGSARRLAVIRHLSWSFAAAGLAVVCVLVYSPDHPWWRALLLCIPVLVVIAQAVYGARRHFSDNGLRQAFARPKETVS
jgi:O-antigen/teichoic acid export membrane protein